MMPQVKPRMELEIRRKIKAAMDAGDPRAELEARRMLRDITNPQTPDLGGNFMVDMGRGFMDVAQGAKQLGLMAGERMGMAEPGAAQDYTAGLADEIGMYEADRGSMNVGRFTGNLLATAPIPGGVAGGVGMRMGTGALAGAGVGAILPTTGENLVEDKLTGAGVGLLGGAAGSAVMSGASKGINMLRGRYGNQSAQTASDLAEQYGVRLTAGDAAGGSVLPRVETTLETIPFVGMGGVREIQTKEAKKAAERLLSRSGDRGQDIGDVIQKSASREFQTRRDIAKVLFDEIRTEADQYGAIPMTRMSRIAKDRIAELEDILARNPAQQVDIERKIAALRPFADEGNMTYTEIREITRANLTDLVDSMYAPGAVIGKKGVGEFETLRKALEADLEDGIKNIGGTTLDKYQTAKLFYQDQVVPYKKGQGVGISALIDSPEPDKLLSQWVRGAKKDKARALYGSLTDDGKEAVRVGIIREAYEKATQGPSSQYGVFSPAAFAREIDMYKDAIPEFFKGAARDEIEGFTRLMQHVKRAGQYMENPPTGARVLTPLAFGAGVGFGSPVAAGSAVAGTYALSQLLSTKAGRALLLSSSKLEIGSKPMQAAINQFERAGFS
jgi:hypothetical protein